MMANGYYSPFKERKVSARGPKTKGGGRVDNNPPALHDSPPGYQPAGAGWGTSFNRKVKAPVVKTRTKKQGLD